MASQTDRPSSYSRVHMLVTGMVQGVGFRYFTVMAARRYGLTGWVRDDKQTRQYNGVAGACARNAHGRTTPHFPSILIMIGN